ncbi:MAG: hypothetical protein K0S70_3179, partial [Microbacterium sp.]|nr:hypothetical protein [Microbacterium sp.]
MTSVMLDGAAQHPLRGLVGIDVEQGVAAVELDDLDTGFAAQPPGIPRRDQLVAVTLVLTAETVAGAGRPDGAAGDDDEVVAEALDDVELVRREQ